MWLLAFRMFVTMDYIDLINYIILLGVSPIVLYNFINSRHRRMIGVHEINQIRGTYGGYHHLFPELRKDRKRFQRYMRMMPETFDYILEKISCKLMKNWTNFIKNPIYPEEKLVITLR